MILTCPQCSTRYQADAAKFPPAGRRVRCAKCTHTWHQLHPDAPAEPEPDDTVVESPQPPKTAEPESRPQAFTRESVAEEDDFETAPRREPSRAIESGDTDTTAGRGGWRNIELFAVAGWSVLVFLILVIGWSAYTFREDVAVYWPKSASLYSAIGLGVNPRGIAFDGVSYHKGNEDGAPVLTVTGQLVNISQRELPVPQIRIALTDKDKRELFSWTYVPNVLTLKPGQVAPFRTRLASPPEGAKHLELTFVKAGE